VPGINAKTGLVGQIRIVNDKPRLVVTDFNLGKLPLPKSTNQRIEQLLNVLVNLEMSDFPITITSVEIKSRQITITGLTRPTK
jgi:hypothetical protein